MCGLLLSLKEHYEEAETCFLSVMAEYPRWSDGKYDNCNPNKMLNKSFKGGGYYSFSTRVGNYTKVNKCVVKWLKGT